MAADDKAITQLVLNVFTMNIFFSRVVDGVAVAEKFLTSLP